MSPVSDSIVFKGDVSADVQAQIRRFADAVVSRGAFAHSVGSKLVATEVEISTRKKDGKPQCRMMFETTVDDEMANWYGSLHGGCAVFLIDVCSSVAITALAMHLDKPSYFVSQALNTSFHAPAPSGAKIEIVNTTVAFGARTVSTLTEIWDVTNGRLCMTGTHTKMAPSQPKL